MNNTYLIMTCAAIAGLCWQAANEQDTHQFMRYFNRGAAFVMIALCAGFMMLQYVDITE